MNHNKPSFDEAAAHAHFAVECFNRTWTLIDKPARTADETAEMIHMAHASRWHWGHCAHVTPKNLSVAAWQLSRVYAEANHAAEAARYGHEALAIAQRHDLPPFFIAYGHEALARAAALLGDNAERDARIADAAALAELIHDAQERKLLLDDLSTIRPMPPAK